MSRPDRPDPAIAREVTTKDAAEEILRTVYNNVQFHRGLGDSGYRLEIVEHECETCGYDRMLRMYRVNPESPDEVRLWCNYPGCPDYHEDAFGYARR